MPHHYARLIVVAIAITAVSAPIYAHQEPPAELAAKARQGDAEAQAALGAMYADGRGVPQDNAESFRLFGLAAEQGVALAQYRVGMSYFVNLSVRPQDLVQAHM